MVLGTTLCDFSINCDSFFSSDFLRGEINLSRRKFIHDLNVLYYTGLLRLMII